MPHLNFTFWAKTSNLFDDKWYVYQYMSTSKKKNYKDWMISFSCWLILPKMCLQLVKPVCDTDADSCLSWYQFLKHEETRSIKLNWCLSVADYCLSIFWGFLSPNSCTNHLQVYPENDQGHSQSGGSKVSLTPSHPFFPLEMICFKLVDIQILWFRWWEILNSKSLHNTNHSLLIKNITYFIKITALMVMWWMSSSGLTQGDLPPLPQKILAIPYWRTSRQGMQHSARTELHPFPFLKVHY